MELFSKIKNMFGNKEEDIKISQKGDLFNIIKNSGISEENLKQITKYGELDQDIKKSLFLTLNFKKCEIKSAYIEFLNIETCYQIAKVCNFKHIVFTFNPSCNFEKYGYKSKISASINSNYSSDFNGLIVVLKGSKVENIPKIEINQNNGNFTFLSMNSKNIGGLLNLVFNNKDTIIGFSSSKSVLDSHLSGVNQLYYNILQIQKSKKRAVISEMSLMQKFQSKNAEINFDEVFFSLDKIKEFAGNKSLESLGVKITPEMVKALEKQKSIIEAMTEKERKNPSILNHQRILRIAKGSGNTIEMVKNLISLIAKMKQQGMASFMSPDMMNMLKK